MKVGFSIINFKISLDFTSFILYNITMDN